MSDGPTSEDLWAQALQKVSDDDKNAVNFDSTGNKLQKLIELRSLTEHAREECTRKRWKFVRGGKTVILRDVFSKIIFWIDLFKRIGDATTKASGDTKAGLAWLGVQFLLQIAVNDIHKYAFVVEGAELISRLIDRYTVFETLYLQDSASQAEEQLRNALIRLYTAILRYLAKAKAYYEKNTMSRILIGAINAHEDFQTLLDAMEQEEIHVDRCATIVDAEYRNAQNKKLLSVLSELEAGRKDLLQIIKVMDGPIRQMSSQVSEIQDHLERGKRLDILRWISLLPYQEYHDQHRRSVLEGTGQWLLTDPVYAKWKNDSTSSLLWLHGIPGCGKSKLMAIVTEELLQEHKEGCNSLPVFFYCSRNTAEPERSRPDDVLASIARQLASQGLPGSPLCQPTIDLYFDECGSNSTRISSGKVLPLIQELIEFRSVTYIIIDALDECDPATRCDLLDVLHDLIQDPLNLVKVFVSSRDDQDIVDTLHDAPSISVTSQRNRADLTGFVTRETENLVSKRRLLRYSVEKKELKALIIHKLIEGADGMFLWVTLQLEVLCSMKLDDDIRERLGRLPSKLIQLYSEIHEQLVLTPATRLATETILRWLLCARDTLQTATFLAAISLNPRRWLGGTKQPQRSFTKEQVLDLCCNLVIYDDELDTFRFAHLSVREFLEQRPEYSSSLSNVLAAETCLVEIIHSAGTPSTTRHLSATYSIDSSHPFLPTTEALHKYAIYSWHRHCTFAGAERSNRPFEETFRFFLSNDSGDRCPLDIWVQSRRQKKFETAGGHELVRLLENYPDTATRSFFVACAYGFCEIIHLRIPGVSNMLKQSGLLLAAMFGQVEVLRILHDDPEIDITEDMIAEIVRHWSNASDVLPAILAQSQLRITEFIFHQATNATNVETMRVLLDYAGDTKEVTDGVLQMAAFWGTPEMMELLLDRLEDDRRISETMMGLAASNDLQVLKILLHHGAMITTHVVLKAAQHRSQGTEVLELLASHGAEIIPTEELMNAAAAEGNAPTMLFLLAKGGHVTVEVMKSAANNIRFGTSILEVLFDHWNGELSDDSEQELLKIAAGNMYEGEGLVRLLFEKLKDPRITPSIMEAGAKSSWVAEEVITQLLQRGGRSHVTAEVIIAAAHKSGTYGTEVVSLLLREGRNIEITEEVLIAVIGSVDYNECVQAMFGSAPDALITQNVLLAAFGNYRSAVDMTKMIFDRVGKGNLRITSDVVKACVENNKSGMDALSSLEHFAGPIEVTDETVKFAAQAGSVRMLQTLLGRLPNAKVSEELMVAAAANWDPDVLMFLLDKGGLEFVTDEVLKVVVAERYDNMLPILLRRADISNISESVAKAAFTECKRYVAHQRRIIKYLLSQSQATVQITGNVVAAAVDNQKHLGQDVIHLLLQYCKDRNIPLSVDYSASVQ